MVVIGYDRYNVIVKGFSGKKISPGMAFMILLVIWTYSTAICSTPFIGWGNYKAEGLLITCSYDFITPELNERTFLLFAYIFNYFFPVFLITLFYYSIVKAVVAHEAALKAQAKKMNVDSLRSGTKDNEESAEVKIAKVAITNVLLWICIWTPYAAISALPVFWISICCYSLGFSASKLHGQNSIMHKPNSLCCLPSKVQRGHGKGASMFWHWGET